MGSINTKRLPSKIQELRKAKSLTQKQMAQALGLSEAMFSRIESGERAMQPNQIDVFAKILDADVSELRTLSLADRLVAETNEYSDTEIEQAFKTLNKGY